MTDFHVREFAHILAHQPPHRQRDHMVDWFRSQTTRGAGQYTRQQPNRSARITYQRLQNPRSIIWIGATLGAPPQAIEAATAAIAAEPNRKLHPTIARQHLPWDLIAELAQHQIRQQRPRNTRARREAACPPSSRASPPAPRSAPSSPPKTGPSSSP